MKKVYVKESLIHGNGLFAGEDIKSGDFISYVKGDLKSKINKTIKDSLSNPDWIGIGNNKWIDPKKPWKYLNHNCNPTASIVGRIKLTAVSNIKKGEEITLDYSTIEGDKNWSLDCVCGHKICRKKINSVHFLPKFLFKKYKQFMPTYFKNLYLKSK